MKLFLLAFYITFSATSAFAYELSGETASFCSKRETLKKKYSSEAYRSSLLKETGYDILSLSVGFFNSQNQRYIDSVSDEMEKNLDELCLVKSPNDVFAKYNTAHPDGKLATN
ncbi:MAG: hypothetical protein K2Q18_12445, partial [Bdellovibrionales bacterium]|nr:hypothetical protein [Bdellovibrionales bacterium]